MALREGHETVLTICHFDGTAWLSTTRESMVKRCKSKGWKVAEEYKNEEGKVHRWLFKMDADLVRIVPKSRADRDAATARGKANYAAKLAQNGGIAKRVGT